MNREEFEEARSLLETYERIDGIIELLLDEKENENIQYPIIPLFIGNRLTAAAGMLISKNIEFLKQDLLELLPRKKNEIAAKLKTFGVEVQ